MLIDVVPPTASTPGRTSVKLKRRDALKLASVTVVGGATLAVAVKARGFGPEQTISADEPHSQAFLGHGARRRREALKRGRLPLR